MWARISRTYKRLAYHLQVLTLQDEAGIEQTQRVTDEHPYCRDGDGWTPARMLRAGDRVHGAMGMLEVVANVGQPHPAGVAVYNLEVQAAHSYFVRAQGADDAEAAWVHNTCDPTETYLPPDEVRAIGGRSRMIDLGNPEWAENAEGLNPKAAYILFDRNSGEVLKIGESADWITRFEAEYQSLQSLTNRQLAARVIELPGASTQQLSAAENSIRGDLESAGEFLPWDNEGGRLGPLGMLPREYGNWNGLRSWLTRYPNW